MNKKFLNAVLFGALIASSAGTFTSCKDYDDDIKSLQEQIDKSGSTVGDLQTQLTTLKSAAEAAQAAADAAKTAAAEAKTAPQKLQKLPATRLLPMLLQRKRWQKKRKLPLRQQADAIAEAATQVEALRNSMQAAIDNKLDVTVHVLL